MSTRLIIDGNSVYEIDEECEMRKSQERRRTDTKRSGWGMRPQEKHRKAGRKS